ncbi:inner membrane CreD family protein [Jannaschia rubra]|uniref:inner membrane CreD family protein n=1 Tax=Jannaschia rubra TaxID=282197 RepID=UPI00248F5241|nr:inner membrane CreD family protein [Jannaschia rubra]
MRASAAAVGDPHGIGPVTARLPLDSGQDLKVVPVARTTRVAMAGDWPVPAFTAALLPDDDVNDAGFPAVWTVPHLARRIPQVDRGDRLAHPVQHIPIGLAQSTVVLHMVAYAERAGFTAAYVGSAAAIVALFGWIGLRLGRQAWAPGGLLIVLYVALCLILRSTDLAPLEGAMLAFAALTPTIVLTRNEDWCGPGRSLQRRAPAGSQAKADSSAISTMSPKDD